ncbi:MAG TPA: tetratricopeptide repeat protein [Candidatus Dormibacteraeota bacterium]|nr:tetratricopeptide repeat protein [Candidatus Dormibacteraeota bacterium]
MAWRAEATSTRARRRSAGFFAAGSETPWTLHVHLGNLQFRTKPKAALAHYQTGVAIGERALPPKHGGVLPWGWIDNRPFLRALNGMAICLWRRKRFDEAAAAIDAQLWLTPGDEVGARLIRDDIRGRVPWKHGDDDDGR